MGAICAGASTCRENGEWHVSCALLAVEHCPRTSIQVLVIEGFRPPPLPFKAFLVARADSDGNRGPGHRASPQAEFGRYGRGAWPVHHGRHKRGGCLQGPRLRCRQLVEASGGAGWPCSISPMDPRFDSRQELKNLKQGCSLP